MNKRRVKNGLGFCLLFILSFLFFGAKAQALPPDVDSLFKEANANFDSVAEIHETLIEPGNSEIEKIEKKLYYLGLGLKNQKEAKKGSFAWIDSLIAKLLLHQDYPGLPEDVQKSFDSANYYFDMVDTVHNLKGELPDSVNTCFEEANWFFKQVDFIHEGPWDPITKIEMNIDTLTRGLICQKYAKWWSFYDLEAKLDTLLGREFKGIDPEAEFCFESADSCFDSVFYIDPAWPESLKIEKKLYYLALALHWQKLAKEIMFYELESKLYELLGPDPPPLHPDVEGSYYCANQAFDQVIEIHTTWQDPEEVKIEWKIFYLSQGLICQKDAMHLMFFYLEEKADMFSGRPFEGLPEDADSFFSWADACFDSINMIHNEPGPDHWIDIELKLVHLAHGLIWEKEAKWLMFSELKRKLFEFDKVELKLHYLNQALKYQKHAKRRMFEELEIKLDILLDQDYPGHLPPPVEEYFSLANEYFDKVDSVHQSLDTTELARIETKLYYMNNGLIWQKKGMRIMFDSLEFKLDSLLPEPYHGLPDTVIYFFNTADIYFDLVNTVHEGSGITMTELEKIELKLYYLSQGLKYEKDAKWMMFDTLEHKIDSLSTGVEETGEKEAIPDKFILLQNYPNPFNPKTNIEFILKEQSWVTVEIYNLLGQRIKVVADRKFGVGSHSIYWDGKDEKGKEVSSGIYFYRVKTKDSVKTKKMVLVK